MYPEEDAADAIKRSTSTLRPAVRNRCHFPNDRAAAELFYKALRSVACKWKNQLQYWQEAHTEFSIRFGNRSRMLAS